MRLAPNLGFVIVLATSACIGSIKEYSDEASDEPMGDGDGDPTTETGEATGDGDGEPTGDGDGDPTGDGDGDGDGDGEPTGDGDGDCPAGSPGCPCKEGMCDPGYECVQGSCELSDNPYGKCGWDPMNEWYACGFEGESPDPDFPIDCGNLPLVDGAPCPNGFTVEGCCRIGGDAWWCQDGLVERDVCGI
jgi:hypothetical protein